MGNSFAKQLKAQSGKAEVDLSKQDLHELPPEIGALKACIKLNLSDNNLTSLPLEIGMHHHKTTRLGCSLADDPNRLFAQAAGPQHEQEQPLGVPTGRV